LSQGPTTKHEAVLTGTFASSIQNALAKSEEENDVYIVIVTRQFTRIQNFQLERCLLQKPDPQEGSVNMIQLNF